MRYVHFEKVVAILRLAACESTSLSAGEIEKLGVRDGIFLRADGKPFSRSTMYHYRKVMEHLGLLRLEHSTYQIGTSEAVEKLVAAPPDNTLSVSDKEILASLIVNDPTCRRVFFDFMMEQHEYQLAELRSAGKALRIISEAASSLASEGDSKRVPHGTGIQIVAENGRVRVFSSPDQINAVVWGVRLWALELGITDEMLLWYTNGRLVVPISIHAGASEAALEIQKAIAMMLHEPLRTEDWALVSVPALLEFAFRSSRFPLAQLKLGLETFQQRYPQQVMFIPSTTALIDLRSPYSKQEKLIRNAYVKLENGEIVSHIRIKTSLLKEAT